jgi:large subunit ribosomal protein LX
MKTKIFKVQGKFMMGRGLKHFTKELKAVSEDDIREKRYS